MTHGAAGIWGLDRVLSALLEVLADRWVGVFGSDRVVCGLGITTWNIGRRGAGVGEPGWGIGVSRKGSASRDGNCTGAVMHFD